MIKIIDNPISQEEVNGFLGKPYAEMIKFVVDIRLGRVALGGELHSDAEALLLKEGSSQSDLWGGNFFPSQPQDKRIKYTSMINIRPSAGNPSMEVQNAKIRARMKAIAERFLP